MKPSIHVKNLGVYLDQYMSFERHVDEIYKKTISSLIYLNRVKNQVTPDMQVILVQTLALSYLKLLF